jgi:hypothetical protein
LTASLGWTRTPTPSPAGLIVVDAATHDTDGFSLT